MNAITRLLCIYEVSVRFLSVNIVVEQQFLFTLSVCLLYVFVCVCACVSVSVPLCSIVCLYNVCLLLWTKLPEINTMMMMMMMIKSATRFLCVKRLKTSSGKVVV